KSRLLRCVPSFQMQRSVVVFGLRHRTKQKHPKVKLLPIDEYSNDMEAAGVSSNKFVVISQWRPYSICPSRATMRWGAMALAEWRRIAKACAYVIAACQRDAGLWHYPTTDDDRGRAYAVADGSEELDRLRTDFGYESI